MNPSLQPHPHPTSIRVNSAPRCSGHAAGMADPMLPSRGRANYFATGVSIGGWPFWLAA